MASTFAMQACRNITELHTLCSTQEKQIEELSERLKEKEDGDCSPISLSYERQGQRREIEKLKKENEELTKSADAWKKSFWKRDGEVKQLLEFRDGVADALELSNPDLVEPDDVSNKICEITDDLEEEQQTCHQLKDFAMNVHNHVYGTNYDDEDISTAFDYDMIIKKMKDDEDEKDKEIEKLKKIIKETKRAMGHSVSDTEEEEEEEQ